MLNKNDYSSENPSHRNESADDLDIEICNWSYSDTCWNYNDKSLMLHKGILRTSCIDCPYRTKIVQYACDLVALGTQLYVLGFIETPKN